MTISAQTVAFTNVKVIPIDRTEVMFSKLNKFMRTTLPAMIFSLMILTVVCFKTQAQSELKTNKQITIGEVLSIRSKKLDEDREVRVFLPRSYANSNKKYPVIYTLDGEGTGSMTAGAAEFMTGYSAIPQMPEIIVVAVINANRNRDMPIPEGYGNAGEEKFLGFLADELVPAIEKKYRTEPLRILLGHSQGGLFAHFSMSARPEVFRWILSIDAPLTGFAAVKPLLEKIKASAKNRKTGQRLVSVENLYGWRNEWKSLKDSADANYYAERIEIKDETHETMAYKGIYEGLKRLFYDYAPNIIRNNKVIQTLPLLEERYKEISTAYGYQVEIPSQLLLGAADQNIAVQHGAEAFELVKKAIGLYGQSFATERRLKEAEEAVKKGRNPKLEELMNLPAPSIESMKSFLGTWERKEDAVWMIAFEIKDEQFRAENTVIPPGFEPFHLEVQFVRVLAGKKLQWGERNGRGPGITVYTAELTDENTLTGTAEQIGFMMPRPSFSFTYKRRTKN